jgi:hypothetical protein
MVLIEFLFAGKNIEDQALSYSEKIWLLQLFLWDVLFSFLTALPPGILHKSEWVGEDMRSKIHLLWQHAKIVRIHRFSEYSKVSPKFRTLAVVDH